VFSTPRLLEQEVATSMKVCKHKNVTESVETPLVLLLRQLQRCCSTNFALDDF